MVDSSKKIISVITINLNDKTGLQSTIDSVKTQNCSQAEHIIIDGGSTDGSVELIKNNSSLFSRWISEKDNGVYDAQNKGIKVASGEYLIFLNSGDTFYSSSVLNSFLVFSKERKAGIIYGNSNVIKADAGFEELVSPNEITLNFWYRKTINHQAVFFRKDVFERYGFYDTSYKFSADLDILLKVFKKEPETFLHFDHVVCNYHEVGLSAKPENYDALISEKEKILKKHLSDKEYSEAKEHYLKEQTFRTRMRIYISGKPWLRSLVGKLYSKK
jgi:glycosyltransferase involved in cell wall biosynthesis